MKNHRRKRRKKGKALHAHEKETLSEAIEINHPLKEEVREMKPSNLQFNLVFADHYSLYERTSVREKTRKEGANSEFVLENNREETKRVMKGEPKSALPPLKEKTQRRKHLTFAGKRRACEHSILDTQPSEARNVAEKSQNITGNCSESQKKLASLPFVGIYDLDDMGKTETNKKDKLNSILKSGKQVKQGDEVEISSEEIAEGGEETSERTKSYFIQTLTLEGQSPLSRTTLFQDKLLLPCIKGNALLPRPRKIFHDENKTSKRRQRLHWESENRLPKIAQSVNRIPRSYRGKLRAWDHSFKQVSLERNIPRLPLIVNGRMLHL